jgi:hypothetical protein
MEQLYGDGDHFITEYGFASGPRQWNTEVYFYRKYTLTLQVDVIIDYNSHTVRKTASAPIFYLDEVKSVDPTDHSATYSHQWKLNETQWEKLVRAKGDWSVLDIPVKTNQPVDGFDEYVHRMRAPLVRIPH